METASNPFNDYVFIHATPAERGSFTLATDKALAKLEKFQLPDPTFFILQWIQAIVASGAQRIDVTYSSQTLMNQFELEITFDGPGYTRTEVDSLYDHVFRSGRDRDVDRLRELALGWLSACSLPIHHMALESNGRKRLRTKTGGVTGEKTESTLSPREQSDTTIVAESRLHRLSMAGKGNYPFDEILGRRCAEVPCPLHFNTNLISTASGPSGVPWPNRPFRNGPTQGVMGSTYGGSAASHLSFVRYGVEFVSRSEPSLQPPAIVRVQDPTLSKNVSQTDVVKDEAYDEFLGRIRVEMKKMGLELTKRRIPGYQRESLNRFIQAYLAAHIDVRVFEDPERLKRMGEEYRNLIDFPLFSVAGASYHSLADIRKEYRAKGFLLYSLDKRAQVTRWNGMLLVLELEEVAVLRKFFSNLTNLTFEEVRMLSRGTMQHKLSDAQKRPVVCQTQYNLNEDGLDSLALIFQLPDTYPTGTTILAQKSENHGSTLPGVGLTLIIRTAADVKLNSSDLAQLRQSLHKPVEQLLRLLCQELADPEISSNQSRMRYAELACEMILYLHQRHDKLGLTETSLEQFDELVLRAPVIGLENGDLASISDLLTFLKVAETVYRGGAFVEGLESGALDPMPCAAKLVESLLHPSQLVNVDDLRDRIEKDPEIKFQLRRQTLLKGLANNPNPHLALKHFASEAAAQATLVAQLEKEYKQALEGKKLFVQPDEARIEELSRAVDEEEFQGFELPSFERQPSPTVATAPTSHSPTVPLKPPPLPTPDSDLALLRNSQGDFCSAPGAIHIERRDEQYSLHLSTIWQSNQDGYLHVLRQDKKESLLSPLPIEGFLRICPTSQMASVDILQEAIEQLVIKVIHSFKEEPRLARQRQRLRTWLQGCFQNWQLWSGAGNNIGKELTNLPLIPCLGHRHLSLAQLRYQAKRLGQTLISDPHSREAGPDSVHHVIDLHENWRDALLQSLNFPRIAVWHGQQEKPDFTVLLRSAWRELNIVVTGDNEELIRSDVLGRLSEEASFWTKWRAGFLSWDESNERALVNPNHKLGKKLLQRFGPDHSWAPVFASALFSTINRGLQEVEDHHEQAFLIGLLDTLE